ncbi:Molybdopterin biosynthesis MoaE [Aureobasidium subglaciale]|nr:Molybdopterin biosynthesis MoaE [Aureobasidium subglaciale]
MSRSIVETTQVNNKPTELTEDGIFVALTHDTLDAVAIMNKVRSPKAGAIVLFAGTTRDNFGDKPVVHLAYEAYAPLAIRTMARIAHEIKVKHGLNGVAMIHRLGVVPIAEESILIAVSSPHRQAAWQAGEEALELTKEKVEVWKLEEFGGEEGGVVTHEAVAAEEARMALAVGGS